MKEKLMRFMQGRYGVDALGKFTLYLAVALMVLGLFFRNGVFDSFALLLLVIGYFRMFSRNIQKRYEENVKFTGMKNRFLHFFKTRKTHHIYKCPNCRQKIRIPKGKGKIEITCPKCSERFIKKS